MKIPLAIPLKSVPPSRQRGLTLVELMIAITVGLLLLTGLSLLIVQQSSSRSELEKSGRQIENGRYALESLRNDIEHAGFYSDYSPPSGSSYLRPDPCDFTDHTADLGTTGNLGWINSSFTAPTVPVPIYGYPNAADPMPTCLTNYKTGTAVLVIRRTDTTTAGTTNLQVSQCTTDTVPFVLGTGGFTLHKRDCSNLAVQRAYLVRIYYISTCDECGSDTIPTLKVVENGGAPKPLAEGIENMQFEYGLDTNGDGSPDSYTATPLTVNWPDVMAVRASLLARNIEPTVGYQDSKKYYLGTVEVPAALDQYKRHVYSEVVWAINPSGRREP
jgi:type IV pilus assembly protein PilW